MGKTLYILRHGETDYNRRNIVQGSGVDTELNELGRQQARAFFEQYHPLTRFDIVITSALRRTHQTVAPFLHTGLPWRQYAELNELSWGAHEGQFSTPEMAAEYRQVTERWTAGDLRAAIQAGETAEEMGARLIRFIEWVKVRPEKQLLVCSHGRAMRALICLLKEEPLSRMEQYNHSNTALYLVHLRDNRFFFERENDTSHLLRLSSGLAESLSQQTGHPSGQ